MNVPDDTVHPDLSLSCALPCPATPESWILKNKGYLLFVSSSQYPVPNLEPLGVLQVIVMVKADLSGVLFWGITLCYSGWMETMPFTVFSRGLFIIMKYSVKICILRRRASGDTVRRQLFSVSILWSIRERSFGGTNKWKTHWCQSFFQQICKKMK